MYGNGLCHVSRYKHKSLQYLVECNAFLIWDLVKASIVQTWAMPKLGTLDYLCEARVRVNVMPNT